MADHTPEPDGRPGIDLDAVLRRSRARRRPKQLLVGGAAALAAVGLVVPAVGASGMFASSDRTTAGASAPESATDSDSGGEAGQTTSQEDVGSGTADGTRRPSLESLRLCGSTLADDLIASGPLTLTVAFPDGAADGTPLTGTATLVNTGDRAVHGSTASAATIAVAADSVVVWHSDSVGDDGGTAVDLEPGESVTLPAAFTPVRCTAADDGADGFPDDLPPLPAGEYRVVAALSVLLDGTPTAGDDSESGVLLASGPAAVVTLR